MENGKTFFSNGNLKQAYHIAYLIAGFIKQDLSEAEEEELDQWVNASDDNLRLFDELTDPKNKESAMAYLESIPTEEYLRRSKRELTFNKGINIRRIISYAVAASVIITAGLLIYFKPFSKDGPGKDPVSDLLKNDLLPGSEFATLTLGDGKKISLGQRSSDTTINEFILVHGGSGEIIYNENGNDTTQFHTLAVPRKGSYKLVLPDQSIVYLNAGSSIRYPTRFEGNERRVTVTGETFFEVNPQPLMGGNKKTFIVVANDMKIEAVGTAFNVNVYPDEPIASTTLTEGIVKIKMGNKTETLRPGYQFQWNGRSSSVVNANTDAITAWKDNKFKFTNTSIQAIMRQLARWYDAEVVYEDNVDAALNATIDRNVPVSKVLSLLSKTGEVHFTIEDRKIIVSH